MTPSDIERVFGHSRLKMVTGEHVEVYREEAQPGERRRYTKRFLETTAGDFRHWTEREWRILARLVGHGIVCVPDVVQFDRGSAGRLALVQTYDAGITVDHWVTLLPVEREGRVLQHVFEDCAHWWALAQHSLTALDAIHDLQLVHLDLKADNLCIPHAPADFDPASAGQLLAPRFDQIALIDFAFALVSGEHLTHALPIGQQADYDYQSPRLLRALEAGRNGDLQPTRALDWRCDMFSLAAMLERYLPRPGREADGWTEARHAQARGLVGRLFEIHDAALPMQRPHKLLIAQAAKVLSDVSLNASLKLGWQLAANAASAALDTPTPVTRIAVPVPPILTSAMPKEPRRVKARQWPWVAGFVTAGAVAVPLLGEAWLAIDGSGRHSARVSATADVKQGRSAIPSAAPAPGVEPPIETEVATQAATQAASPVADAAHEPPAAAQESASNKPRGQAPRTSFEASAEPEPPAPAPVVQPKRAEAVATPPAPIAAPAPVTAKAQRSKPAQHIVATPAPRPTVRPAPLRTAQKKPQPAKPVVVAKAAPPHAAPAVLPALAALMSSARAPTPSISQTATRQPSAFPATPQSSEQPMPKPIALSAPAPAPTSAPAPAPTPIAVATPPSVQIADEPAASARLPDDFAERAEELLANYLPHIAQRAERVVARVLQVAARSDAPWQDDTIRDAARAVRLGRDDTLASMKTAAGDARRLHDAAIVAFWQGRNAQRALTLQERAFGANPLDPEIPGKLAYYQLKQRPAQVETARQLSLYAVTMDDAQQPYGRVDDWMTFAVASALAGRQRDAANALFVTLAISPGVDGPCRSALAAYALHGERMRLPAEAMLYRVRSWGRSDESPFCRWPPSWAARVRSP